MNKGELVKAVAAKAELSQAAAGKAIDAAISSISESLAKNNEVTLIGFGTFSVKNRSERKGRNPSTGAEITIKASRLAHFKAGKSLKNAVNC